jgi:threonine 3-dehydrogenase
MTIGHEFCGEVVKIGKDVHTIQVGDRIAAESHIPCQKCHLCKTGRMHICENMQIYGIQTRHGAFAEYAPIPESIAYKLPDSISDEEGALFEPFGVAMHAIERAQLQLGDAVLVLGAGPIGIFCAQLARLSGATPLIVSEMKDTRLRMVESLNVADVIVNSAKEDVAKKVMETTGGRGPDVVIEAAGSSVTVKQAFEMLGKNGRLVLMGLPTKTTDIDTTRDITYKEADVRGTTGRLMYQTWDRMSRIIAYKRIDLKRVITHRFPLVEIEAGFKSIIEGKACKVIILP